MQNKRDYYKQLYEEWAETGQIKDHLTITCTRCEVDASVSKELSMSQLKFGNRICKKCLNARARDSYQSHRKSRIWEIRKERLNSLYNVSLTADDLIQVYQAFDKRCVFSNVLVEPKDVTFHLVNKEMPAVKRNLMLVMKTASSVVQRPQFVPSAEMVKRIRKAHSRI